MVDFNVILFDGFETLDALGPVEIIGELKEQYKLKFYSMKGGLVTSTQQVQVMSEPLSTINPDGILFIPGGVVAKKLVDDEIFIEQIRELATKAVFVLTVCTGSALLAKTGFLNGKRATSNKRAFEWVQSVSSDVEWVKKARWVVDGNIYTSSGVSAGMDMTLGFLYDIHGKEVVNKITRGIEYIWNSDKDVDPFGV